LLLLLFLGIPIPLLMMFFSFLVISKYVTSNIIKEILDFLLILGKSRFIELINMFVIFIVIVIGISIRIMSIILTLMNIGSFFNNDFSCKYRFGIIDDIVNDVGIIINELIENVKRIERVLIASKIIGIGSYFDDSVTHYWFNPHHELTVSNPNTTYQYYQCFHYYLLFIWYYLPSIQYQIISLYIISYSMLLNQIWPCKQRFTQHIYFCHNDNQLSHVW